MSPYNSRRWEDGRWQHEVDLGEVRDAKQKYDSGAMPAITPLRVIIGEIDCISNGEATVPNPRWQLVDSVLEPGGLTIQEALQFPSLTFTWNANLPVICQDILGRDGLGILGHDNNGILASCDCCQDILGRDGLGILGHDNNGILASCDCCQDILGRDGLGILGHDNDGILALCI